MVDLTGTLAPSEVTRQYFENKSNYFVDVQLWPIKSELNCERWLENFEPQELEHAVQLLNAFTYFSGRIVDELFRTYLINGEAGS